MHYTRLIMKNEGIILAGGSGFLGQALTRELLARQREVIILTRKPTAQSGPVRQLEWDGRTIGSWAECLNSARAVVNLAGRSVNCRHTRENRRQILESRVNSVKVIGEAISRCAKPPPVWVQASSMAIYGDTGDRWCDESTPAGQGYLEETCVQWEKALFNSPTPATRKVALRIGFVLAKDEGALSVLAKVVRAGLGGRAGSGRQYVSWLHIADMNRIFLEALDREDFEGRFNAAGPNPVTNAEFMRELRQALRRAWSPPAPVWAVRLGSWLLRTEAGLALTGRRCAPKRLLDKKFTFEFPNLRDALANLYP
jgi:uncharacterized protein (TIGR01777 family)